MQVLGIDDLVDEPELHRLLGADRAPGQHEAAVRAPTAARSISNGAVGNGTPTFSSGTPIVPPDISR